MAYLAWQHVAEANIYRYDRERIPLLVLLLYREHLAIWYQFLQERHSIVPVPKSTAARVLSMAHDVQNVHIRLQKPKIHAFVIHKME